MPRQDLMVKRVAGSVQQVAAWLFFLSVPIANVPALVYGSLILFLLAGLLAADKTQPPLSTLLIFGLYVLVATASLSWTFEFNNTLTALKREVYIPTLVFFVFYCLRFPGQRKVMVSGLLIGLVAVVEIFVAESIPMPEHLKSLVQHYNPGVGDFSTFAILLIPVFYVAYIGAKSSRLARTIFYIVVAAFVLFAGYLTKNRMFWPASSVTLFALFVFSLISRRAVFKRQHVAMVAAVACILLALSLAFAFVKNHTAPQVSVGGQVEKVVDRDPRWKIWQYWVQLIEARPVLGYGYGRFVALRHSEIPIKADDQQALSGGHGHNIFLNQCSEIGIVGLISFLVMWVLLWRQYWRHIRHPAVRHFAIAGLVLMIAYLTKNMTDDFYTRRNLLMFWALNGLWLRTVHDKLRHVTRTEVGAT